jgi:hypothetical protein
LSGFVTACGYIFSIGGETDAADYAGVFEGVEDLDVECSGDIFVEDCKPIVALAFVLGGGAVEVLVD